MNEWLLCRVFGIKDPIKKIKKKDSRKWIVASLNSWIDKNEFSNGKHDKNLHICKKSKWITELFLQQFQNYFSAVGKKKLTEKCWWGILLK